MSLSANNFTTRKKIGAMMIVGIWLMFTISLLGNLVELLSVGGRVEKEEAEVVKLIEEKEALEEEKRKVESPGADEVYIREELGLVKPGEAVVVIPDELIEKVMVADQGIEKPEVEEEKPVWVQWVELFW